MIELSGFEKELDALMADAALSLSVEEYEQFIEYIKREWMR